MKDSVYMGIECSIWCKFNHGKHVDSCPLRTTTHEEMIAKFEKDSPGFKEGYEKELRKLEANKNKTP